MPCACRRPVPSIRTSPSEKGRQRHGYHDGIDDTQSLLVHLEAVARCGARHAFTTGFDLGGAVCARRRRRGRAPSAECEDRKSTRLNSSHSQISYAVFCLKKKKKKKKKNQKKTTQ